MAGPCLQSFYRNLWFLTKELVILVLGNDKLPEELCKEVATVLYNTPRNLDLPLGKPKFPEIASLDLSPGLACLKEFVGKESWVIPNLLGLTEEDMVWLQLEVHQ